jgi:flavin-dependent dehydrogenase
MHDSTIIIVGGGPAGLTTALALVRAAPRLRSRVIVLERERYPRDKICGGAVSGRAWARLVELGATPRVPVARVTEVELRGQHGVTRGRLPGAGHVGYVARRIEFDADLAERVRASGVELREGVSVTAIRHERGAAVLETSAGPMLARAVVGAGGIGCPVRKAMGLGAGRLRAQVVEVDTDWAAEERDWGLLRFDVSDPELLGYAWDFPTNIDGRLRVCRGVYWLRIDERGERREANQPVEREASPHGGRRPSTGGFHGRKTNPNIVAHLQARLDTRGVEPDGGRFKRYAERGYDPDVPLVDGRCMLVGEAAGIDPITGEGIGPAIEAAVVAGRFLAHVMAQPPHTSELDGWQREFSRSLIGRDLALRSMVATHLFARRRLLLDHLLTSDDVVLDAAARYFAGHWIDPRTLGRTATSLARAWLRHSIV